MSVVIRVCIAAVLLPAGLAGCAAPSEQQKQALAADEQAQRDVVCFFEAPTGMLRKVKRCMSKDEYKKAAETAQRTADEIRTPPPDVRGR